MAHYHSLSQIELLVGLIIYNATDQPNNEVKLKLFALPWLSQPKSTFFCRQNEILQAIEMPMNYWLLHSALMD